MTSEPQRVRPDPQVVERQNALSDLWHAAVADHAGDPNYDPDDDPVFVAKAREVMGLPPLE